MEEIKTDQANETEPVEVQLDDDTTELISSLNPHLQHNEGSDKPILIYDGQGFQKTLEKIKAKGEGIVIENDLIGLKIVMESKTKNIKELQDLAHQSILFMMKNTPTKIPLGVG